MSLKARFNTASKTVRKNNSGRPRKESSERRSQKISSAYTKEEYAKVIALSETAGTSPSIYQRQAALNATVTAASLSPGLRLAVLQEILTQARHCRATCHKIERRTAHNPHAFTPHDLARINTLVDTITIALRQEIGLDPR